MPRHAARPGPAVDEFAGSSLPDERLDRRLQSVAETLSTAPALSFPRLAPDPSALEAIYRFLSNSKVKHDAILQPHAASTAARARGFKRVIVVHDSSEFGFGGEAEREGLGQLTMGRRGFLGHFSLCVGMGAVAAPLGVLRFETMSRLKHPRKKARNLRINETRKKPRAERQSSRWERGAITTDEQLAVDSVSPIHVMDQEADDYALFAEMMRHSLRFVVRGSSSRNTTEGEMAGLLEKEPAHFLREVPLSRRSEKRSKENKRRHPPRTARQAKLHVRATTVTLNRWVYSGVDTPSVTLNVVQVFEPSPPENEPPVEWNLLTNEPIETDEDLARIVDAYAARWMIEEYFKALKTGCAIERRQLESAHALHNALAVFSVIAWRLLALRTASRVAPKSPATVMFSEDQIALMRLIGERKPRARLPPGRPTVRDMLLAIAGLGGHLKQNGDPGWMVLGRGYDDFTAAELGWWAAKHHVEM